MEAQDISSAGVASTGINVDYDTGTITFDEFGRTKLSKLGLIQTNTFSPSLPVWVYLDNVMVPIDWTTWGPGALDMSSVTAATSDAVDLSGWNNLLWYFIPKDHTCSGVHSPPTVIGTTVYFTCDDGYLYALDTEMGESKGKEITQKPLWVTNIGSTLMSKDTAASVAGANGVLMVPGSDGLHAFTDTTTLVTDNSRVVELDGQGEVTWSVDSIAWPSTTPASAGKAMAMKQGPVNKPSRARYANTGEILFANTGANQVCKIDKGGMVGFDGTSGKYIRWIYSKFADPKHLLRSGQPTQLRSPTDAIMWQEMEPVASGGTASVIHCLIADSGNSRILDLTYRVKNGEFVDSDGNVINPAKNPGDAEFIDNDSGFMMPELNWVSKTDSRNERYAFDCLQLISSCKDNNGNTVPAGDASSDGRFYQDIWVASSNFTSNGTNTGGDSPRGSAGLGGAIMEIGYRNRTISNTAAAGPWVYDPTRSGTITARCDHVELDGAVVPLANPRFFDVVIEPMAGGALQRSLLICDNYGVYKATIGGPVPSVVQHLLVQDYPRLLRLPDPAMTLDSSCPDFPPIAVPQVPFPGRPPLMATCVQKLPTGRWLITNGYSGSDPSGTMNFGGEVFEYDPMGGAGQEVKWCSPRVEWVKPPTSAGPCAPPLEWKQVTTNTYNLRQPKSGFRQL